MKKKIVILFGGVSCEHDISIITAFQTYMNIDTSIYDVYCAYICKNKTWKLISNFDDIKKFSSQIAKAQEVTLLPSSNVLYCKKGRTLKELCQIDCVVNCTHGINGEDGSVAGLLNLSGVACTSCDMLQSALGIDKSEFARYIKSLEIPQVKKVSICREEFFDNAQKIASKIKDELGFPVIIKPARLGSSIGIKVCKNIHDLPTFIENALKFDKKVLVEEYLTDINEYNIALYKSLDGLKMSKIESPKMAGEILSFNNKYIKEKNSPASYISATVKPAKINKKLKNEIEKYSSMCYEKMQLRGVVRFDFIFDKANEKLYLNEINTVPGSLANYLFTNIDKEFMEQLTDQIEFAIHEKLLDDKLITYFESSVLENIDGDSLTKCRK